MQFQKDKISCIRQVMDEIKDQEVTQEIKLSEGQPDMESVLGAWGQVLIRSKEWENGYISISGGVMTWVMYTSEEAMEPVMVESWIPFTCKWDIPKDNRDGTFCISPLLRMMDARSISARKIMVRAGLSFCVKAMLPCEKEVFSPKQVPEQVLLHSMEQDVLMPCECGEKPFSLDEELQLPDTAERIMRYQLKPYITETKVMGEKLVFRGGATLSGLYEKDQRIQSFSLDIPFAQYAPLENEFDPEAIAYLYPAVTGLEVDLGEEGRLRLKAGLTVQYIICDKKHMETITDAYSNENELQLQTGALELQNISPMEEMRFQAKCPADIQGQILDRVFLPDHPRTCRIPEGMDVQLNGRYQTIYYDLSGVLRSETSKWEDGICIPCPEDCTIQLDVDLDENGNEQSVTLHGAQMKNISIPNVEMIEVGGSKPKNESRPSLIICKAGQESLWEIAKRSGSTVKHIYQANHLEGEPVPGQIILIPVL